MNALLASLSHSWGSLTDRQKLIVTFTTLGPGIDRMGRTGFWAGGRRYIFDENDELKDVKDYTVDGRMNKNVGLPANG